LAVETLTWLPPCKNTCTFGDIKITTNDDLVVVVRQRGEGSVEAKVEGKVSTALETLE
jgi:hypothetical protein